MESVVQAPVARAQMLIRRPVGDVFRSLIEPAITSRFWFTKSSGPLRAGESVRWDWDMYGVGTTVDVKAIEENRRILIDWDGPEDANSVEWTFEPVGDDCTFVTVKNWGFHGEPDRIVSRALDSTGGFSFLLASMKAYLEHGIELDLVADHSPTAIVAGWKRRERRSSVSVAPTPSAPRRT